MESRVLRRPFVAGQFYESNPTLLKKQIQRYVTDEKDKTDVKAIVSPHAGYIFSGSVAGAVYSRINFPDTFIILSPNHTGLGAMVSVFSEGIWDIPLHNFEIDEDLAKSILKKNAICKSDFNAHLYEHSIEVQLPFIAYFSKSVRIVPITIMKLPLKECIALGKDIANAIKESGKKVVVVASSDMSHYVTDEVARNLDNLAIQEILNLNEKGLYDVVSNKNISMCGVIPVTTTIACAKELGANQTTLVKYATSAEVSGDYRHVVGYAGIMMY
ncbi:MAG: AmmeMemoRadiSam system protein B [Thermodesulfovibrionales bacterium]|nr:AmmeMemoRadiSam system protein B [Thermodesulfovibrionales bacterium]